MYNLHGEIDLVRLLVDSDNVGLSCSTPQHVERINTPLLTTSSSGTPFEVE